MLSPEVLSQCAELFQTQTKDGVVVAIELDVKAGLTVLGDKFRVSPVLNNFVGNARKFTPSGSVTVGVRLAGDLIRFEVVDTGAGTSANTLTKLFTAFSRLSRCGRWRFRTHPSPPYVCWWPRTTESTSW